MASQYKDMNDQELAKTLAEKRSQLREFRFDVAGAKAGNIQEKRQAKKDIARILTELRRREKQTAAE